MTRMPPDRCQFEYVEGQFRAGFPELLQAFQRESDRIAASPDARIDFAYGPHARQCLDVFPATAPPRGIMVFLHAGYWQSRDKSTFRWLADAFQRRGLHMVLANYRLCPEVTLAELVESLDGCLAAAVEAVAATTAADGARLPLVVTGHSAGGHLAIELALRHGHRPRGTPGRVDGVWALSGIYDLDPLRHTTLNVNLQLDEEAARRMSPIHRVGDSGGDDGGDDHGVPSVWVVGGDETPEFLRQNSEMHAAWAAHGHWSRCVEVPSADHFTLLRSWAALSGELDAVFEDWWKAVVRRHAV